MIKSPSTPSKAKLQAIAQYLTFSLGTETFAINIRSVREIIQHGPMTAMPLMPAFVRGVINVRGAVVPVIDLHARFGHAAASIGNKSCIVIFDDERAGERAMLGLLVDAVSEVIEIAQDQIEPPPSLGTSVKQDLILGLGKVAGRFVIILEPGHSFDVGEMAGLCAASEQAALA